MLESLEASPKIDGHRSVTLFWGARTEGDLYLDIANMFRDIQYVPVLSRASGWNGERGHVQEAFARKGIDLSRCMVYACGSQAMIADVSAICIDSGVASGQFLSDAFVSTSPM